MISRLDEIIDNHYAKAARGEGSEVSDLDITWLIEKLSLAVKHLTAVCAPEPDGLGGFVADEFTQPEVLEARKWLDTITERSE